MIKPDYKYKFGISDEALKSLDTIPRTDRRQIGYAMDGLQQDLRGDIKKLKGFTDIYRLRVGDFRVFFKLVKDHIQVYEITNRKDAYGN
jgi:mRNA interferase RelE/StbE